MWAILILLIIPYSFLQFRSFKFPSTVLNSNLNSLIPRTLDLAVPKLHVYNRLCTENRAQHNVNYQCIIIALYVHLHVHVRVAVHVLYTYMYCTHTVRKHMDFTCNFAVYCRQEFGRNTWFERRPTKWTTRQQQKEFIITLSCKSGMTMAAERDRNMKNGTVTETRGSPCSVQREGTSSTSANLLVTSLHKTTESARDYRPS